MVRVHPVFLVVLCALLQTTWGTAASEKQNVRIAGGRAISIKDAPWMAAIFVINPVDFSYTYCCGGSIIHELFILTAANCVHEGGTWKVLVGTEHLSNGGFFIDVKQSLCHENYKHPALANDICLLKLAETVPLGSKVAKVLWPLHLLGDQKSYRMNVSGWGYTKNQGKIQCNLRQTTVSVASNDFCRLFYPNLTLDQLCAGISGQDACARDGGGPMTYNGMQIGIMSRPECGLRPSVYTKVASYATWITNTIQNSTLHN